MATLSTMLVTMLIIYAKSVYSQCTAQSTSYCVTGLDVRDDYGYISSQYTQKGMINNCPYFQTLPLFAGSNATLYLYWDSYDDWTITTNFSDGSYSAFCTKTSLDDCGLGEWFVAPNPPSINTNVQITQCSGYNNTICESTNINMTQEDDIYSFCIGNTAHRSVNRLSGEYIYRSCSQGKPFYALYNGSNFDVIFIAWHDQLKVWFITDNETLSAWSNYGYCMFDDINDCNHNWYMWDGLVISLDELIISGYCNTCIDNPGYDEDQVCLVGGISDGPTIGVYEYEKCHHLIPSFVINVNDSDITLHYDADVDSISITIGYSPKHTYRYCIGYNITACIEQNQWYISSSGAWILEDNDKFAISNCNDVYNQCNNDSEYCLPDVSDDPFDTNITGRYRFHECDTNDFPIYYRYQTVDNVFINESLSDAKIYFDYDTVRFLLTSKNESNIKYGWCNALTMKSCDGFWRIHAEMNLSECISETDDESFLDWVNRNWYYIFIGAIVFIIIVSILSWFMYKRCKLRNQNDDQIPLVSNSTDFRP